MIVGATVALVGPVCRLGKVLSVLSDDDTWTLSKRAQRLDDVITERSGLWQDSGGRALMSRHLRPHAVAVGELLDAFRRRDQALAALQVDLVRVREQVGMAQREGNGCDEDVARVKVAVAQVDRAVEEMLLADARAAELEAEAIRLADLANAFSGDGVEKHEPPPALPGRRRGESSRPATLRQLQGAYPALRVAHIIDGEFNGRGKFTGFHCRRSEVGKVETEEDPDSKGVYVATVSGRRPDSRRVPKDVPEHTMFPDDWSENRICFEIMSARRRAKWLTATKWQGESLAKVPIVGSLRPDGTVVAYPLLSERPNGN